jgi:predicted O-methyltransferase YrrM
MAGSLLNAIGLPELITTCVAEYEEEAVRLGCNRDAVTALKRKLNDNQSKFPLFNVPQLVRDLECAYESVAKRCASGVKDLRAVSIEKGRQPVSSLSPQEIVANLAIAQAKVEIGMFADARAIYEQVLRQIPNQRAAVEMLSILDQREHVQAAKERFPGPEYLEWLSWLHQVLKPAGYLEIGVETGQSLRFAQRPTKAVGIDPQIHIVHSQECWVKLFKQTSDDFFAQHDLHEVMDGNAVDLAFIDGLHTFDQALKDFFNIERYAHAGTVVVLHDIFPVTPITAARNRQSLFWLGDTWKATVILRKTRPDLRIVTLPTFPSGLTLVTGLNSGARDIAEGIDGIIKEWMGVDLDLYMKDLETELNVVENDFESLAKWLAVGADRATP